MTTYVTPTRLGQLSYLLLCATTVSTVAFSGVSGGNEFNYLVTVAFIAVACVAAVLEHRPIQFFPESLLLAAWITYAMLPNLAAEDIELAMLRTQQMLQIALLLLVTLNVMSWYKRPEILLFLFVASGITAYLSALAGFGFGIIDDEVLQEINQSDRVVGTHGNANKFGRLMVEAQLAAILCAVRVQTKVMQACLAAAIIILGIAVVNSGSRTALVGMVLTFIGLVWAFRLWQIRALIRAFVVLTLLFVTSGVVFYAISDNEFVAQRIDSFLQNEKLYARYSNLIVLLTTGGDVEAIDASEGSVSGRAQLMANSWRVALSSPFGLGFNNFKAEFGQYAHSNYFEILATTGFPGLVLYVAIYALMCRRAFQPTIARLSTDMCARVFLISVLVMMVTDVANVSYYSKPYWLFLACAIGALDLYSPRVPRADHSLSLVSTER